MRQSSISSIINGVGEMQVSFSIIIIICYDKNDLIMKHKVSQYKYLETIYYNLWTPII